MNLVFVSLTVLPFSSLVNLSVPQLTVTLHNAGKRSYVVQIREYEPPETEAEQLARWLGLDEGD